MISSFRELVEVAKTLRGPNGCPWDKSRTLLSLQGDFMEEAEEVKQALEKGDYENLREELGDILFNIVLMAVIAEEEGRFTMKDILVDIREKIIRRHTWVFGDDKASTPEEALAIWAKNKEKERAEKRAEDGADSGVRGSAKAVGRAVTGKGTKRVRKGKSKKSK